MRTIDLRSPTVRPLPAVEHLINNSWVALFRGHGMISSVIQGFTQGPWTHAGLLAKSTGGVDLLEVREFAGGRRVPLFGEASRYPGQIDVFSVNAELRWPFDPAISVERMRWLTSRDYGWCGAFRLGISRTPLIRRLYSWSTDDVAEGKKRPFCSEAVAISLRAGGVDSVPNCPDADVTPSMLARSMFLEYQFTLE